MCVCVFVYSCIHSCVLIFWEYIIRTDSFVNSHIHTSTNWSRWTDGNYINISGYLAILTWHFLISHHHTRGSVQYTYIPSLQIISTTKLVSQHDTPFKVNQFFLVGTLNRIFIWVIWLDAFLLNCVVLEWRSLLFKNVLRWLCLVSSVLGESCSELLIGLIYLGLKVRLRMSTQEHSCILKLLMHNLVCKYVNVKWITWDQCTCV